MLKLLGKWCGRAMALLVAIGATTAWAVPSVTDLVLVSEKRITRTVYQYTYKVTLQNDATALTDVVALAQSAGPGTTIVDNNATLPSLAANATQTTADTIVLRHDRLKPFRKDLIVWSVTGTPVRAGIILSGDPAATVQTAMPEYDAGHLVPESEISIDAATGARILRTALYVVFRQDATVTDVNAALSSIHGRILASLQGNGVVSVGIPDAGSLAALDVIMHALRANPAVEFVLLDVLPEPAVLPNADANTLRRLDHHLAVRGAAAWNAKKAFAIAPNKPSMLIADGFGGGAPGPEFGINWKNSSEFSTGVPESHGYHVTGIISGSFGGAGQVGEVTGMVPTGPTITPLSGDVIEWSPIETFLPEWLNKPSWWIRLAKKLHSTNGNIVVNSSMTHDDLRCEPNVSDDTAREYASAWLRLLRGDEPSEPSALEDRFFHATAAGNNNCPASVIYSDPRLQVAKFSGPMGAAALLPENSLGFPPLRNTLTVENRMVVPGSSSGSVSSKPGCTYWGTVKGSNVAHGASYREGHVSAIGSRLAVSSEEAGVWSFLDAAPSNAGGKFGTSMSTPQVSGLAIYLWSLRPDLTGPEVAGAITNHTRPPATCGGGDISNTPVIDAYATILSADRNFDDAPARKTILDVNEDGVFDSSDTLLFLENMYIRQGTSVGHSRFDLNGDGFTGGLGTEWVNLDMSYDTSDRTKSTYGLITAADNGTPMSIDEKAVTDHQMLCYYVNSRLFPHDQLGNVRAQIFALQQQTGRTDIPLCEAVKTVSLNDTGITFCGEYSSGNNSPCTGTEPAGQDAHYGRDAMAAAGTLIKVGGGTAGFDFTALDENGQPTTPTSGPNPHWCVRDNVTGLIWEVKTDDGGLRDKDWTYSSYNSNPTSNSGFSGYPDRGNNCYAPERCDTEKYVADANAIALCGYSDWRLPSRQELQSIANYGRSNPAIDPIYFPNTPGGAHVWSSSLLSWALYAAWSVEQSYGSVVWNFRDEGLHVRLVRGRE